VAEDGWRTFAQRCRAAMAGDEPSLVLPRFNILHQSTREDERITMVGSVSPESSPSVS